MLVAAWHPRSGVLFELILELDTGRQSDIEIVQGLEMTLEQSVDKPWERLMKMTKLNITPHHVASSLALKGAPLSVVRDLLGHHSIEVTTRYLSVR